MLQLLRPFALALTSLATLVSLPAVSVQDNVCDFGVVPADTAAVRCCFKLVNDRPEAFSVVSASTSCACTTVDYPKTPIQPADTALVWVTYRPNYKPGQVKQRVYLTVMADSVQFLNLFVRGVVVE